MKRNVSLAALALCLAVFGSLPAPAEQPIHERATSDPLEQLFNAGWVQASPGVLKRDLGHGQFEVLGLGAEGLQYRLQDLREQLWHLKATYDEHPTPELKDAIRAYRSEIRRVMEHMETAKSFDALETETQAAGIDCTINYGAHVNAFPLTGSAQGVGANADAYFNSNCGQTGEVWAHAYGEGRKADNSWWTATKTDPLAGGSAPYTGTNVRAVASISLNVVSQCYSYAYASMTSYDIGVVYSQSATNYSCPSTPLSASVSSNYGNSITLYGYDCATVTWTASPSGGTTPYTYSWTANTSTTVVSTAQTYSRTFCGSNVTTTSSWTAKANVKDSSSPQQSVNPSHTLTIYYYYQYQGGGGGCSYTTEDGKIIPEQPICP